MFRGKRRIRRWATICFIGMVLILGAVCSSFAYVPNEPASQTFFLPLCPPKTSLEMNLKDPKEVAPNVTITWGDRLPLFISGHNQGGGATLDSTSHQMSAKFLFTPSSELRVSFLYNQDQPSGQTPIGPASHLLFRYSMDYCVMPTLKVGMTGYLYKPPNDYFAWRSNNLSEPVYGLGPGVQYDLGRWSFLLISQLESGTKDRGEALHNWFRVWYAF
jgi:hypothetical protein